MKVGSRRISGICSPTDSNSSNSVFSTQKNKERKMLHQQTFSANYSRRIVLLKRLALTGEPTNGLRQDLLAGLPQCLGEDE